MVEGGGGEDMVGGEGGGEGIDWMVS